MNDDHFFQPVIHIPTCWSPEQALVIADFLGDIVSAILHTYDSDIIRHFEQSSPSRPHGSTGIQSQEDDIPF